VINFTQQQQKNKTQKFKLIHTIMFYCFLTVEIKESGVSSFTITSVISIVWQIKAV